MLKSSLAPTHFPQHRFVLYHCFSRVSLGKLRALNKATEHEKKLMQLHDHLAEIKSEHSSGKVPDKKNLVY